MRSLRLSAALRSVVRRPASLVHAQSTGADRRRRCSPRNASYSIDARLDPASRTITASEVITWRNITTRPVDDLQLPPVLERVARRPLDLAARASARPATGTGSRGPDDRSRIDVSARPLDRTAANRSISPRRLRFIAPDDGNADDRTVMSGAAAAAGGARRHADDRDRRGPRTCRARSRGPAPSATSSSSPSGFPSSACCRTTAGTAISSTRAPSSSPTTASTTSG